MNHFEKGCLLYTGKYGTSICYKLHNYITDKLKPTNCYKLYKLRILPLIRCGKPLLTDYITSQHTFYIYLKL
jgi:hypothetical protein